MGYQLDHFINDCRKQISSCNNAANCVSHLVPFMVKLLQSDSDFLLPEHKLTDDEHYRRNPIFLIDGEIGLYSLVWKKGQWTPVHDHGTWGIVGIVQGNLQETSYIRTDHGGKDAKENLELVFGNVMVLSPGSVTSFVPNPDHIHKTGNSFDETVISIHLYGHEMSGYHEYDLQNKSRSWIDMREP